ncbi:uncharacterized protein LOC121596151 isoform X2 [Anopheles merus]|uniref:uncharacterized protein LOC121596151 isoform X2 n=1 Tax=Anopheles merus TaxID=30066 RepID=UPI001BE4C348|nr:uncharacterized protein LOC121596151 isoform X2 [Anopheles merus]
MAPRKEKPKQEQQVALLNDNLFTCVLTAGTNVKKYTRLVEKNEHQFDLMEVSKFVFDLVQSRTKPLDVNAKIVCGMCYIFLFNVQKLRDRILIVDQKHFKGRKIGYKEKNVVRQFEVECRPGKDGRPKVPITLDELLTMDIDMHMEAGSEKDVIDALLASQQSTTVQNVDDITLRELPPSLRHDEEYQAVDNDFGEARSNELLDFFNDSAQEPETEPASMIHSDLPVTQDDLMDIDPSLEPELDAVDSVRDILPLEEDTLQPVPMYVSDDEDNKDGIELIPLNASFYAVKEEENSIDETTQNPPIENNLIGEKRHEMAPTNVVPKKRSRLIVDVFTQISTNCLSRQLAKCAKTTVTMEQPRQEVQAFLAEQKLNQLFAEPLRPWLHSFLYKRHLTVRKERATHLSKFEFSKKKTTKRDKNGTCKSNAPQTEEAQTAVIVPPIETFAPIEVPTELPGVPAMVTTAEPAPCVEPTYNNAPTSMRSFLTRFTGNPAEWEYLKRTEDPHSEKRKDKKDEGVVTSHALLVVLRSLFDELADESIPFEMIQAKMGSRQIAASLFAKLLELSATKIIRIVTNEYGLPVMVQKFQNWPLHFRNDKVVT